MSEAFVAMDFGFLTDPASTNIADSDARVVQRVYGTIIGDLVYLSREKAVDVIDRRVKSLVDAYPLSAPTQKNEKTMLIVSLGDAAHTNPAAVERVVRARLSQNNLDEDASLPLKAIVDEFDTPLPREEILKLDIDPQLRSYRILFRSEMGEPPKKTSQ
jgi:hypothetical protein